jgi:hypothetical protein
MIQNTDSISHLQSDDDTKYGHYPSINKLTMTQTAPQFFDAERIPGYKQLKQPTFFEGGGGASVCLDDGCGGDVVDFLVMTRVGVSSSRCWMEWLCRVFRPAILHKATNVTLCSCTGLCRTNKHSSHCTSHSEPCISATVQASS